MDRSFSQIKRRHSRLPRNYAEIMAGTFVNEMCLSVRELEVDSNGNSKYTWTKGEDHSRHADTYSMLSAEMMKDAIIEDVYIG